MPAKLFISYSHDDEKFRAALVAHLSQMIRNGQVEVWSDRKIMAGQEWGTEIDARLESSDIAIFLVSPSFLSSSYCNDIEATRALELHQASKLSVVPIIVRHCDWKNAPFSALQALPLDAKPVSRWPDPDEAWLSVIEGIKPLLSNAHEGALLPRQATIWHSVLSPQFYEWLNDTEVELAHRRVKKVALSDVFVGPDLKDLELDLGKLTSVVTFDEPIKEPGWKLIFGDEQSGKTSLAKRYYEILLQRGWIPVLLHGNEIKDSDPNLAVKKAYQRQYTNSDWEQIKKSEQLMIVIDDYSDNNLNKKYQNNFINRLKGRYPFAVLLAIDSFQYVVPELSALDGFRRYEIQHFGNLKRAELIENWVSIGIKEQIEEKELYDNVDVLKTHIDTFVNRNIVPSKPIYLLTILQTFETFKPQHIELTSYGHCYQYLILRALETARIKPTEIDSYINVLTDLARAIFENGGIGLSDADLTAFFKNYHAKYLRVDPRRVMEDLGNCRVLCTRDGKTSFRYRYIYYFYAAKYFAEQLSRKSTESKERIRELIAFLHKEDSANIIIFITHHTKDEWVLEEIQLCMMELFSSYPEATLQSQELGFMTDFLQHIPKLVIEQRSIESERKHANRRQDMQEEAQAKMDERVEKLEPTDLLAQINRTFKGIELLGQVVRNRYGSLEKDVLKQIVTQAYSVGLRFLQFFLTLSDASREEVVQIIEHMLRENPEVRNEALEKEARSVFLLVTYGVIYGVLSKIASSMGSREATEVYQEIENEIGSPAIKLISQAIELQFLKRVDDDRLRNLAEEFSGNVVCRRILQEIVIQHIYMHAVGYKEKQRISQVLGLPMSTQRNQELQRSLKMS